MAARAALAGARNWAACAPWASTTAAVPCRPRPACCKGCDPRKTRQETDMNTPTAPVANVAPPGPSFNFAQHLIERNAGRSAKTAYIDDQGLLSYGELAQRIRRLDSALLASGVRREERVLLLMHDCNDWPVAFLGAMHASVVPVSAALLPVLQSAMTRGEHEVRRVIASRPTAPLAEGVLDFEGFLALGESHAAPAATGPDDPGFWLYSSGSTGRPKGTVHLQGNPYWTAELYGGPILGLREDDICFSAAKLFFAYGLGNALSF